MSLTSGLFKAARLSATGRAVHTVRRAKNIAVGRTLAKTGVWSKLWK